MFGNEGEQLLWQMKAKKKKRKPKKGVLHFGLTLALSF